MVDHALHARISAAITAALRRLPEVFAGWDSRTCTRGGGRYGGVGAPDHHLDVERHGEKVPFFDKGDWLRPTPLDEGALAMRRDRRYRELQTWFPMSQVFVRKAILRGQHVEAVNAFWAATLKPLADLLRMRYCPVRWDFGMRYLDRDLPPAAYAQVLDLALVKDLGDLEVKLATATAWGTAPLRELESA